MDYSSPALSWLDIWRHGRLEPRDADRHNGWPWRSLSDQYTDIPGAGRCTTIRHDTTPIRECTEWHHVSRVMDRQRGAYRAIAERYREQITHLTVVNHANDLINVSQSARAIRNGDTGDNWAVGFVRTA